MHEKLFVIDEKLTFFGSTNLTIESLTMHDNILIGVHSESLAKNMTAHLLERSKKTLQTRIKESELEIHFLPDKENALMTAVQSYPELCEKNGLTFILDEIEKAQDSIKMAIFTFTHKQIADALIQAKQRGVKVEVAIDKYNYKGASKKIVGILEEHIPIYMSLGPQLFHHKWILIDKTTLILGSANFTQAAFNKNEDYIMKISLSHNKFKEINNIWKTIKHETKLSNRK